MHGQQCLGYQVALVQELAPCPVPVAPRGELLVHGKAVVKGIKIILQIPENHIGPLPGARGCGQKYRKYHHNYPSPHIIHEFGYKHTKNSRSHKVKPAAVSESPLS